jgi:uncharacterized lipoprotein YehR (DUF1307 family)
VSGFIDDDNVKMRKKPTTKGVIDYSEMTLNEFLATHYRIGELGPVLQEVMGPFLGMRLFIVTTKRWSARKRLLRQVKHDIVRYMTQEAGQMILEDYRELRQQAMTSVPWAPTWFESSVPTINEEEQDEKEPTGKRKKENPARNYEPHEQSNSTIHYKNMQNANKVLSSAATTEDANKIALLSSQVSELQDSLAGITSTIGELKDHQHRDQLRMNGLQADVEMISKKAEIATMEIRRCNTTITNMEHRLANLSTKEETTKRFDTLEAMFAEIAGPLRKTHLLTGKLKGAEQDYNETYEEEMIFENQNDNNNSQTLAITHGQEGAGDHTNSHKCSGESNMQVK